MLENTSQTLTWKRPRQDTAEALAALAAALLRLLPAEAAHEFGIWLLRHGALNCLPAPFFEPWTVGMRTAVPGIGELAHPLGLAAGFDKQCLAPVGFARLGFAFLEIGTVTPHPQGGNPKPRLFRQPDQHAIINRMGFNSDGAQTVAARLRSLDWRHDAVPLGVNCGKNKATEADSAIQDYLQVIEVFRDLARYFVINISSPNTPGLRDLATPEFIHGLADELGSRLSGVWIKLDPDMPRREFQAVIEAITERGFQGIIVSNTHRVIEPEVGGQSGHPLAALSLSCLEWAYEVHKGQLPMIASGGVLSGTDVFAKIARGALAVQVYTALIYRGPWVVAKLLRELAAELRLRGFSHVDDARGSHYLA